MNKKQLMVGCIILLFLFSLQVHAQEVKNAGDPVEIISGLELADMNSDLERWTDQKMIEELLKITVNDDYIKKLYSEFRNTIVNPPNPDNYKEYSMPNAEESLIKVAQFGKKIHNLGLTISEGDFNKYGVLLQIMRDILYLDLKHLPLAIKHDNSRDVYWFGLHNKWVREAESMYSTLFNKK